MVNVSLEAELVAVAVPVSWRLHIFNSVYNISVMW